MGKAFHCHGTRSQTQAFLIQHYPKICVILTLTNVSDQRFNKHCLDSDKLWLHWQLAGSSNSQTQVFQLILTGENVLLYVVLIYAVSFYLVTFKTINQTLYDNTLYSYKWYSTVWHVTTNYQKVRGIAIFNGHTKL